MHTVRRQRHKPVRTARWVAVVAILLAGIGWTVVATNDRRSHHDPPVPARVETLGPGVVATTDSSPLTYSPGWTVTEAGADPAEPASPFEEPSGVVTFPYSGDELALQLATGDYWAYLYITVDGRPANLLTSMRGNADSQGTPAGYKTFLEPERVQEDYNADRWVRVHQAGQRGAETQHQVRMEFWRGWGQMPLRAVAVDALPREPMALWPGVLLIVVALWMLAIILLGRLAARGYLPGDSTKAIPASHSSAELDRLDRQIWWLAGGGVALIEIGIWQSSWLLTASGVGVLAIGGIVRPAIWLTVLVFALPFYFSIRLPLLPDRAFSIIDLGIYGGLALIGARWLFIRSVGSLTGLHASSTTPGATRRIRAALPRVFVMSVLALIVSWALVSSVDARYVDVALREWRTVFVNAFLFGLLVLAVLYLSPEPDRDRRAVLVGWLAGAAAVACIGLWGYVTGGSAISTAEGVQRIQALYGSANNLALYLDRTVAVSLALVLFLRSPRERILWAVLLIPQLLALLLTFSKGSLLLALPATLVVLGVGGFWLLRREGRSVRPLVGLIVVVTVVLVILTPFVGAERFQRLFDLSSGTGYLRLQLWRSSWQMALDHSLLGVGPDNFLYAYRSDYILPAAWQEPNLNHPHNIGLDWWTRLGLPGLGLGLLWLGLGVAILVWQIPRTRASVLALGLLAAAVAGLVHGLIDVGYALPDLMLVWVLIFSLGVSSNKAR